MLPCTMGPSIHREKYFENSFEISRSLISKLNMSFDHIARIGIWQMFEQRTIGPIGWVEALFSHFDKNFDNVAFLVKCECHYNLAPLRMCQTLMNNNCCVQSVEFSPHFDQNFVVK